MGTLADLVVRLRTDSAGFERGFAGATRTVGNFERSTIEMSRGLDIAERGMRNLAFRAVGIEGPVGKVAEGLLLFGGGGPLVLGATAGLGAIALAMNLMGKEAAEARANLDSLVQTARSGPGGAIAARPHLQARARDIRGQLSATQMRGPGFSNPMGWQQLVPTIQGPARDALIEESNVINGVLNRLTLSEHELQKAAQAAHDSIADKSWGTAMREQNELWNGLAESVQKANAAFESSFLSKTGMTGPQMFLQQNQTRDASAMGVFAPSGDTLSADVQRAISNAKAGLGSNPLKGFNFPEAPKIANTASSINTLSSAILLLGSVAGSTGSRFGQFLMGAGGLVGSVPGGQLAGAIVGGFGALFNLFGSDSKPLKTQDDHLLAELQKQKRQGPAQVSYVFVGSGSNDAEARQTIVNLHRAGRLGGVPRILPRPA